MLVPAKALACATGSHPDGRSLTVALVIRVR